MSLTTYLGGENFHSEINFSLASISHYYKYHLFSRTLSQAQSSEECLLSSVEVAKSQIQPGQVSSQGLESV